MIWSALALSLQCKLQQLESLIAFNIRSIFLVPAGSRLGIDLDLSLDVQLDMCRHVDPVQPQPRLQLLLFENSVISSKIHTQQLSQQRHALS
jgi:hypothetical protein